MLTVPPAARAACWLNAWLTGRESADETISGVTADGSAEFILRPGEGPLSTALLLAELRLLGAIQVSAALPLPGHPIGLGGPAEFNQDVLDAGEGLVVHGAGLGFIPVVVGSTVRWRGSDAAPPVHLPDVPAADRDLRTALREATERLLELEVTSWSPDIADAILNLRAPIQLDRPLPFASPRAAQTAISGLQAAAIVALAERDESGPVSAAEMASRRAALQPLEIAARVALVAACSCIQAH